MIFHSRQLLSNPLNKSIEFTERGEVSLDVFRVHERGESARPRLEVKDSGVKSNARVLVSIKGTEILRALTI
jgi:hypothetical protein